MNLADFDYQLPEGRIAQRPLAERDASRMLLLDRATARFEDRAFRELPALLRGDETLVFNDTRVIPARLFGRRSGVHAQEPGRRGKARREFLASRIEVLLTRRKSELEWEALVKPGRKMRVGERLRFDNAELEAEVVGRGELGLRTLRFESAANLDAQLERAGHVPLPPYIHRADDEQDRERYQSVFAKEPGAVAAPTASLHFTREIMRAIEQRGCEVCMLTLHVGLGTFQPIHSEDVENHRMQSEVYEISEDAAETLRRAAGARRPLLAVGTTVVRALEDCALRFGEIRPGRREAEIFIRPGHTFRVVGQMLTNFHLPRSSLLVLVCAFAGRENVLRAYRHAVQCGYRFYSYGDCMLLR
jgi:S-adenosylmethionine:tRNA ribosyltransferase-isomerase